METKDKGPGCLMYLFFIAVITSLVAYLYLGVFERDQVVAQGLRFERDTNNHLRALIDLLETSI